jgi:phosphoglycerate dehydrogenase-like enzyme
VGYGAVAQRLTPVLRAMGATVIGWSRTPKVVEGVTFTALDDLIARADIVSLHVPLTPDTAGLISRSRIAAMRAGAVLVNTARGGLVDEAALIDAVTSGRIAAALDVFAQEPVAAAHPLLALPNVVVMPHVAWRTVETLERSIRVAADNVDRLAAGAPLEFQVV